MGIGLGLCCCTAGDITCPIEETLLDAGIDTIPGELQYLIIDLTSVFAPTRWELTTALLFWDGGNTWTRPQIAIDQAGDRTEVILDADFRDVGEDCSKCLSPNELTIRYPSDPNDPLSPLIEEVFEWVQLVEADASSCGQGYWKGLGVCPAGMEVYHSMRLYRENELVASTYRITIAGITTPIADCDKFNGTFDLTLAIDPNDVDVIDGWIVTGLPSGVFPLAWTFFIDGLGANGEKSIFAQFEYHDGRQDNPDGSICPDPFSTTPGLPFQGIGTVIPVLTVILSDTTPGDEGAEFAEYYPIAPATKASVTDKDWSDVVFGSDGFFQQALSCGGVTAAIQAIAFSEV